MALMALWLIAGCQSLPAAQGPVTGRWAAPHISLDLGAAGGRIDYDCAHGTIGPIVAGSGGNFVAEGTHTPGHGGPMRIDEVPPVLKALYSGSVRGDRMTLLGRVESGIVLGPFDLRRGAEPLLTRCL